MHVSLSSVVYQWISLLWPHNMRLWKNTVFFKGKLYSYYRMTSYGYDLSCCGKLQLTVTMLEGCLRLKKIITLLLATFSIPSAVKSRGGLYAWGLPAGLTTGIETYTQIQQTMRSSRERAQSTYSHAHNHATCLNGGSEGPSDLQVSRFKGIKWTKFWVSFVKCESLSLKLSEKKTAAKQPLWNQQLSHF